MPYAALSTDGSAQIVRLPAAFHLPGTCVKISREGARVVLEPAEADTAASGNGIDRMLAALEEFSDDFMAEGRQQPPMQERA
jgi:antitoxin VapB